MSRPPRGLLDDQPDWAPDGSRLVFTRCPTGRCEIYTIRPDGTGLRRLSGLPGVPGGGDDSHASFTGDGRHIVFTRASGGLRTYPGGDQIEHSDIVVMNLDGKNRRVVLRAPSFQADYEWPMFSPNGSRLVYEHRRSYFADRQMRRALVVASANGKSRKRITPWSLNAGDGPDWSPNGVRILFRSHEDEDEATQSQLYTIRPDGTDLRRLTNFPRGTLVLSATFSPDGKQIVFSKGGIAGQADVFTMRADGTNVRPVTKSHDRCAFRARRPSRGRPRCRHFVRGATTAACSRHEWDRSRNKKKDRHVPHEVHSRADGARGQAGGYARLM